MYIYLLLTSTLFLYLSIFCYAEETYDRQKCEQYCEKRFHENKYYFTPATVSQLNTKAFYHNAWWSEGNGSSTFEVPSETKKVIQFEREITKRELKQLPVSNSCYVWRHKYVAIVTGIYSFSYSGYLGWPYEELLANIMTRHTLLFTKYGTEVENDFWSTTTWDAYRTLTATFDFPICYAFLNRIWAYGIQVAGGQKISESSENHEIRAIKCLGGSYCYQFSWLILMVPPVISQSTDAERTVTWTEGRPGELKCDIEFGWDMAYTAMYGNGLLVEWVELSTNRGITDDLVTRRYMGDTWTPAKASVALHNDTYYRCNVYWIAPKGDLPRLKFTARNPAEYSVVDSIGYREFVQGYEENRRRVAEILKPSGTHIMADQSIYRIIVKSDGDADCDTATDPQQQCDPALQRDCSCRIAPADGRKIYTSHVPVAAAAASETVADPLFSQTIVITLACCVTVLLVVGLLTGVACCRWRRQANQHNNNNFGNGNHVYSLWTDTAAVSYSPIGNNTYVLEASPLPPPPPPLPEHEAYARLA